MSSRILSFLVLVSLCATGCATVLQGSRQRIWVASEPSLATVEVDGHAVGRTPLALELRRSRNHLLQLTKEGYPVRSLTLEGRASDGWYFLDALSGLVPLVVDLMTSDWKSFPSRIHVRFEPSIDVRPVAVAPAAALEAPRQENEPTGPRAGELWFSDGQRVPFPFDGGSLRAKSRVHWNQRDVELRLADGLHAAREAPGPFYDNRVVLHEDSDTYFATPRGHVVSVHVAKVRNGQALIQWQVIDPATPPSWAAKSPPADPPLADTTASKLGMLKMRYGEPTAFPVDGGSILAKARGDDIELQVGDGLAIADRAAGPFDSDRTLLRPGGFGYVRTRGDRIVKLRIATVNPDEVWIDWRRP